MSHEYDSGWQDEDIWHGLGNVRGKGGFPDCQPESLTELREWAGIAWEPVQGPLYVPAAPKLSLVEADTPTPGLESLLGLVGASGDQVSGLPEHEKHRIAFRHVEGWKAIVRSDNHHLLNCARDSYGIVGNTEFFGFVEDVMGRIEDGGVNVHGAMSLKGGAQIVVVTRLTDAFKIPGAEAQGEHYTWATFGNAHDGSASLTCFPSNIAVVCNNTWVAAKTAAEGEWGGGITIRHTKSASEKLEQAKKILSGIRDAREQYLELAEELVGIKFPSALEERFVVDFIPSPPETLISDRVANNIQEARDAVRMILAGPRVQGVGIGGTAYGCLMAATEYLDHVRGFRNMETKFRRQMLRQEPLKAVALKLVREIAKEVVA